MATGLTDRIRNILEAVIIRYTCTGEPVGSSILSKKYIPDISPATIRNMMSIMEGMGYLTQPHTSAGRIPTDKGFRFYIDSILKIRDLSKTERKRIKINCAGIHEIDKVMHRISGILSKFSNCMGAVLAPRFDNIFIKHIELIKLCEYQIMVLLISGSGIVQNHIVRIDKDLKQRDLERMSGYLNYISKGLTIKRLKTQIVKIMKADKASYDQLMANALRLSKIALEQEKDAGKIYVEGATNMLNQPEFTKDLESMRLLVKAFEEKSIIVKILDRAMDAKDTQVLIGSENKIDEIRGCSIITAPYGGNGNIFGTLGVIGPIRMNYARVIPLVNYTAGLLSDIISKREVA